jgi:hypothetical protein
MLVAELDDWIHCSDDKDAQGTCELPVALDEHHKDFVSGHIYTIRVTALAADALLAASGTTQPSSTTCGSVAARVACRQSNELMTYLHMIWVPSRATCCG